MLERELVEEVRVLRRQYRDIVAQVHTHTHAHTHTHTHTHYVCVCVCVFEMIVYIGSYLLFPQVQGTEYSPFDAQQLNLALKSVVEKLEQKGKQISLIERVLASTSRTPRSQSERCSSGRVLSHTPTAALPSRRARSIRSRCGSSCRCN